jgi:hypothetical protein
MLIKIFTILFTFILGVSQAQIEWNNWYGELNHQELFSAAEKGTDSTNYWAAGTISNVSHDDFWLVHFDKIGQIIWSDTLGNLFRNERLIDFSRNAQTGEMWLIGVSNPMDDWSKKQIYLQKLDSNGKLIFEKLDLFSIVETNFTFLEIKAIEGGVLIFHHQTGILRNINSFGSVVWERKFSTVDHHYSKQNISVLPDGGCFITENLMNPSRSIIHRLNSKGKTIWQKNIEFSEDAKPNPFVHSVETDINDQSAYIAIRSKERFDIQKFTSDGQLVWKTELSFKPFENDFRAAWLFQIPNMNQIVLISKDGFQILDDRNGSFIRGDENYNLSKIAKHVHLTDAVLLGNNTFAIVGASGQNKYSYDGYTAQIGSDDFVLINENIHGITAPFDYDYYAQIELTDDDNYYLSNVAFYDESKVGIALRKINEDGSEIWKKGFVGNEDYWSYEMVSSSGGNSYILGHGVDSVNVMKLDDNGNILWKVNFETVGHYSINTCSAPLKAGGIVVFYPSDSGIPLVRYWEARAFDTNGNEIWKRRLFEDQTNGNSSWQINKAMDLGDGTIAVVGSISENTCLAARLDLKMGVSIFEENYLINGYFTDIFPISDGSFFILNYTYSWGNAELNLYKIDSDGQIIKEYKLSMQTGDYNSSLFKAPDGTCILTTIPTNGVLNVFKFSENLELLDQKTINILPNSYWIQELKMLNDGSFLLCGEGTYQNNYDVFLIKTFPSELVSNTFSPNENKLKVFPNPISENQPIQIVLNNDFVGLIKFEIINVDGKIIETFTKEKTNQQLEFSHLLKDIKGAFVVRTTFNNTVVSEIILNFKQ